MVSTDQHARDFFVPVYISWTVYTQANYPYPAAPAGRPQHIGSIPFALIFVPPSPFRSKFIENLGFGNTPSVHVKECSVIVPCLPYVHCLADDHFSVLVGACSGSMVQPPPCMKCKGVMDVLLYFWLKDTLTRQKRRRDRKHTTTCKKQVTHFSGYQSQCSASVYNSAGVCSAGNGIARMRAALHVTGISVVHCDDLLFLEWKSKRAL